MTSARPFSNQDFLGNRRQMRTVSAIDLANRQPATPDDAVSLKIVQHPFVLSPRAMKPDRMVKTRTDERLTPRAWILGEGWMERMGAAGSLRRNIIGRVCKRAGLNDRIFLERTGDPQPGRRMRTLLRDRAAAEDLTPIGRLEIVRLRNIRRHRALLDIRLVFTNLERSREIENWTAGLTRNDTPSQKRSPVSNSIDFVSNRLVTVAAADEVGVE